MYFLKNSIVKPIFDAKGMELIDSTFNENNLKPKDLAEWQDYQKYRDVPHIWGPIRTAKFLGEEEGEKRGLAKGMQKGIQQGMHKGIQKGIEKTKIEMAKKLKNMGASIETIASATGFSLDEIKKL